MTWPHGQAWPRFKRCQRHGLWTPDLQRRILKSMSYFVYNRLYEFIYIYTYIFSVKSQPPRIISLQFPQLLSCISAPVSHLCFGAQESKVHAMRTTLRLPQLHAMRLRLRLGHNGPIILRSEGFGLPKPEVKSCVPNSKLHCCDYVTYLKHSETIYTI